MNNKTIRWHQRFSNLKKAYMQLEANLNITQPNNAEKQGIIKSFEFTFELCWKTLKDYLESQGITTGYPREVLKHAFQNNAVNDGDVWLDMLDKRNLMSHTYDEARASEALGLIRNNYFPAVSALVAFFEKASD